MQVFELLTEHKYIIYTNMPGKYHTTITEDWYMPEHAI